jgi:DNA modification methylase
MSWKLLQGDVMAKLAEIETGTVQTCITSPPYWGLRDYGIDGQIGLEKTPEEYVNKMVQVFREAKRVLRDDGTLWLNLGDTYAANRGCQVPQTKDTGTKRDNDKFNHMAMKADQIGLKSKDLVGIPWRVAFALQADGWYLRSDIIWAKPNPMPESVTDRPTKAHEYIFLLSKRERYFYDAEAVREPGAIPAGTKAAKGSAERFNTPGVNSRPPEYKIYNGTRNRRSVWTTSTQPYPEAHFATFPPKLIEPCILAGTSPRACEICGAPWERMVEKSRSTLSRTDDPTMLTGRRGLNRERPRQSDRYVLAITQNELANKLRTVATGREQEMRETFGSKWDHWTRTDRSGARVPTFADAKKLKTLLGVTIPFDGQPGGWQPTCSCKNEGKGRCIVLDPFAGTGTTLWVAEHFGRDSIGIEISEEYCRLINKRMSSRQMTLFEKGARL